MSSEEFTKLKEQNRQMAIIVQKSIEILEQEILGRTKSREITNATDAEKIEKSSDCSESRSSFEYISGNNNEDSATLSANEISILHVLHGLKHIRDVLNGSIKEFNPHIMEMASHNGDDHDHWEVVDDEVSVVSVTGTEDETASVTKEIQSKQDKIISPTSSPMSIPKTPVAETISTKPAVQPISTPPLQPSPSPSPPSTKVTTSQPPIQQCSNKINPDINTSVSQSSTNEKSKTTPLYSATYSTSSKTPKPTSISFQKPKLTLEDILNDVEKSETTPKPSIVSNSKYSWMIEGYADDDDNSLFNPKRASIGSINNLSGFSGLTDDDVFNKSISTSNQKRTKNSIIAPSTPSSLYSGRIDPLGASQKSTNQESDENIGSTISEKRSTNTSVVPVDDPLGFL
jgi:hypothetical protein